MRTTFILVTTSVITKYPIFIYISARRKFRLNVRSNENEHVYARAELLLYAPAPAETRNASCRMLISSEEVMHDISCPSYAPTNGGGRHISHTRVLVRNKLRGEAKKETTAIPSRVSLRIIPEKMEYITRTRTSGAAVREREGIPAIHVGHGEPKFFNLRRAVSPPPGPAERIYTREVEGLTIYPQLPPLARWALTESPSRRRSYIHLVSRSPRHAPRVRNFASPPVKYFGGCRKNAVLRKLK